MNGQRPIVEGFYDPRTFSVRYNAACPETRHCDIIDPVLDFDEKSVATATFSADAILAHIAKRGYIRTPTTSRRPTT